MRLASLEKEGEETRRKEEEEMKKNENRLIKEQLQEKHKAEINLVRSFSYSFSQYSYFRLWSSYYAFSLLL